MGFNQLTYDLNQYGGHLDYDHLDLAAEETVRALEREFSVVLLAERMEESLVLLAHQLCWPLHNMVAFKKNARVLDNNDTLVRTIMLTLRPV